jgi:hypothetical protein
MTLESRLTNLEEIYSGSNNVTLTLFDNCHSIQYWKDNEPIIYYYRDGIERQKIIETIKEIEQATNLTCFIRRND